MKNFSAVVFAVLFASNSFAAEVCTLAVNGSLAYATCTKGDDNVRSDDWHGDGEVSRRIVIKALLEKGYDVAGNGTLFIKK